MEEDRIISPELENTGEERLENSLRPKTLDEYIGQDKIKENMKIYIEAAKKKRRTIRPCFTIWTTRTWKNDIIQYYI